MSVRVVSAASLFDGHDAAINIMRRLLQQQGAEVVHLGHDRSVDDIVDAAVQEDADAVAVSSYQGGHMEFFSFLVDRLQERGAGHVRVYGGGGGTITPEEIEKLEAHGVARIFSPQDGRRLGLEGMIGTIIAECGGRERTLRGDEVEHLDDAAAVSRLISFLEEHPGEGPELPAGQAPVVGFTGTGGAGKSSVVDELLRRFRTGFPEYRLGLVLVDPTRRRSGGALLGDRIRLNALDERTFVRSLATRQAHRSLSLAVADAVRVLRAARFDLIFVETAGIGQSDSQIVDLVDHSLYVMTPEFGAPTQLEKIDMLELADIVVLNKFDRAGAPDALRDVRKQVRRNGGDPSQVFPTSARRWDDPGTTALYEALRDRVQGRKSRPAPETLETPLVLAASRRRYLAEIAETVRGYREETETLAAAAADAQALARASELTGDESLLERAELEPGLRRQLEAWPERRAAHEAEHQTYRVRDRDIRVANTTETLSGTQLPKVAVPRFEAWGELARFLRAENLPGRFPFTAGVFPFKRDGEDPTRMFAGEGTPERTNRRFHYLSHGQPAKRLSTAFDSVTLYGRDPDPRPDIYGKVGNSGVSVCSVDDAKRLYSGFDLCDPSTSVSMTINGPAPTVLAFYINAAIDQAVERHLRETGGSVEPRIPYRGELPEGHDGLGLMLLGRSGDEVVEPDVYARIKEDVLGRVRGTVQADILKEDQAQNTCIFSTEFSLKVMGDIQAYFTEHEVRNFYSVSISGYHMAEAGANPVTQLAFTLANGFTYVEYYLARGLDVDAFASNFSFFFSIGLDAEYNVLGRVARRIWAVAMKERYGASERSQKLKYHIQTSGRSLHAQEMAFNDIRTTLQALTALQDNCNSLHTNAYDEAVTTPTEESVRRAVAIQLIINRELGLSKNENPLQGSWAVEWLTDAVEDAVLQEFERLSERGGVLGAMELRYQRGRIQDESLLYESRKHSGELPVVGVNTYENPNAEEAAQPKNLMRSSEAERRAQLEGLREFHAHHAPNAPAALARLQAVASAGGNVFEELLETVKVASLGQISEALFEVGGRYRRSM
jgi:methylmalonyl-CoA mutase